MIDNQNKQLGISPSENGSSATVAKLRYKAFISYSHRDEAWASWLQRALERYRVPRRLVGGKGAFGEIPASIAPIFRDREDLSSADDLSATVTRELNDSENLIVICSPSAASSVWVDREIRHFQSLGRAGHIHALIVDGDPQSSEDDYCFPAALTERGDGSKQEPLAADARKYADGKPLACLKLVAGILGIRLDDLRRRDMQRKRRTRTAWLIGVTVVLAVTAWLGFSAFTSQQATLQTQDSTGELLEFMLDDLNKLDPLIGREIVDQNDINLAALIENFGLNRMSGEDLGAKALAWRESGQQSQGEGRLDEAMAHFQKSRAACVALFQRDTTDSERLFELGQAEFWIGYIHMDKGELAEARKAFGRYGAITRRLINAEPRNAEWVMELAYSLMNLGALEGLEEEPDPEKSLELLQAALEYNQIAVVLDPDNEIYRIELGTALAFLADAWKEQCGLGQAHEYRSEGVAIGRQFLDESPDDQSRKLDLAYSLSGLAVVRTQMGLTEQALQNWSESEGLMMQLVEANPTNYHYQWWASFRTQLIAFGLAELGDVELAWQKATEANRVFDTIFADDELVDVDKLAEYGRFKARYSELASKLGRNQIAAEELERSMAVLSQLASHNQGNRFSHYELANAWFEFWQQRGIFPAEAMQPENSWFNNYLNDPGGTRRCSEADLGARLAVMRGKTRIAQEFTSYLLGRGYYEPGFVRFCKNEGLCP